METSFSYCEKDYAFFSTDERKWITKIRKLAIQHPDKVTILASPETNDGCLYCKIPASWMKIQPKRTLELTDEQRKAIAERFAATRNKSEEEYF